MKQIHIARCIKIVRATVLVNYTTSLIVTWAIAGVDECSVKIAGLVVTISFAFLFDASKRPEAKASMSLEVQGSRSVHSYILDTFVHQKTKIQKRRTPDVKFTRVVLCVYMVSWVRESLQQFAVACE